jgi:hypothetical protein
LLADPRLSPDLLADLLPQLAPQPDQILLYGRLLETWAPRISEVDDVLSDLDYEPAFNFDRNNARGFKLGEV